MRHRKYGGGKSVKGRNYTNYLRRNSYDFRDVKDESHGCCEAVSKGWIGLSLSFVMSLRFRVKFFCASTSSTDCDKIA
jgi:hypothetical protein